VLVFCHSIRIAGAAARAERLLLAEPTKGRASGRLVLIGPAAGKLALIAPAPGACKLIGPAAGTPIVLGELEGERGAVGGESVQERSPTAYASAKKTASRGGARINVCRIREGSTIRMFGRQHKTELLQWYQLPLP
jgi:hypothetical protein